MTITLHPWKNVRPWRRHSLVLVVAGAVYVMMGLSTFYVESTPQREQALEFATRWFPLQYWGIVFAAVGLMAIISARWPPISETWGYSALSGLSAGWAAFYATGVFFADSPTQNLNGSFTFGLMAFLWWAISGLVNPDSPIVTERE